MAVICKVPGKNWHTLNWDLVSGSRDNLSSKGLSIYDIYNVSSRLFSLYQGYCEYVERTRMLIERSYHFWHAKQQSLEYLKIEKSKSETMTSCLKKFQKMLSWWSS